MTQRRFLDVGQVRIQAYLARTPQLAGRRGASRAIATATSDAVVAPLVEELSAELGITVERNGEAGDVDGVISVVMPATVGMGDVETIAQRLFSHLRSAIPAGEFEATFGNGDSYVGAMRSEMLPRRQRGDGLASAPPIFDLPVLVRCSVCGVDPAIDLVRLPDESARVCRDCHVRFAGRGERHDVHNRLVSALALDDAEPVDDFGALSALGIDDRRNHLATIAIDGNSVGRLFETLAETDGLSPTVLSAISRRMHEVAFDALRRATEAIMELRTRAGGSGNVVPVVVHVLGGDDVLASVPASLGWTFAITFVEAFEALMGEAIAEEVPDEYRGRLRAPTASGGVVFAQAKDPFDASRELAERGMARAKVCTQAMDHPVGSLGWIDVTRDGPAWPAGRNPISLTQIDAQRGLLDELAAAWRDRSGAAHSLETAAATDVVMARRQAIRLGGFDEAAEYLRHREDVGVMADLISASRWWYA